MDETLPQTPTGESNTSSGESWNDSIARSLDEQRARARKFLSGYNERLADLETDLTNQVERIIQQLAHAKGDRDDGALELASQADQLTKLQEMLGKREEEWRAEQTVAEQQHRETAEILHKDQDRLQREFADLQRQREELTQLEEQLDEARRDRVFDEQEREQLEIQQTELIEAQASLAKDREQLDSQRDSLSAQAEDEDEKKLSLARELESLDRQREEVQQQRDAFEQDRETLEQGQASLQQQLHDLQQRDDALQDRQTGEVAAVEEQCARLREQLDNSQSAVEQTQEQLEKQQRTMDAQSEDASRLQSQLAGLSRELQVTRDEAVAAANGSEDQLHTIFTERDRLRQHISELEAQLAKSQQRASVADQLPKTQQQLDAALSKTEQADERIIELEAQLSESQERAAVADQLPETQQQLDAALSKAEQADERIIELEAQLSESQERASVADQLPETQQQLDAALSKAGQADERIIELEAQLSESQERLNEKLDIDQAAIAQAEQQRKLAEQASESVEQQLEILEDRRSRTARQRRRIAREMKSQRADQEKQWKKRQSELQKRSAEVDEQREETIQEIARQRDALRVQLDEQQSQAEQRAAEAARLAEEVTALRATAKHAAHTDSVLIELQRDHEALKGQLDEQARSAHEKGRQLADEAAQRAAEAGQSQQQIDTLSDQLEQAVAKGGADQAELREQLTAHKKQLNQRAEELNELRVQVSQLNEERETLNQQLATASASGDADSLALGKECDKLKGQIVELESRLANSDGSAATADLQNLRKRFELAIEDVRDLKKQNSQLEEKLSRASSSTAPAADASGEGFDWESQKQRLLASLESDFEDDDEETKKARLTIEGTVRITDQVVADKDQEIADLTRLLDEQSNRVGDVAVGAAAIAGMLDQDELIQQERENLKHATEEWREKLGKAELEISLERAKIARERAEYEEQLQDLKSRLGDIAAGDSPSSTPANPGKPARGRWLAKLGLKDKDDE